MLLENEQIPTFSLINQNDVTRSNTDFIGQWLVLYFYPKDDTPGCTKEACSFRDSWRVLSQHKITVVGVSRDSSKSHKKFQEKYHLPFELLSDPDATTIQAFGSWGKKKFMGREYLGILRTTFLVNPEGIIVKIYRNVTPADHAKEIIIDFLTLKK